MYFIAEPVFWLMQVYGLTNLVGRPSAPEAFQTRKEDTIKDTNSTSTSINFKVGVSTSKSLYSVGGTVLTTLAMFRMHVMATIGRSMGGFVRKMADGQLLYFTLLTYTSTDPIDPLTSYG